MYGEEIDILYMYSMLGLRNKYRYRVSHSSNSYDVFMLLYGFMLPPVCVAMVIYSLNVCSVCSCRRRLYYQILDHIDCVSCL